MCLREQSQTKNVTKSGKSPKGGESAPKIKKSKIQNWDFLIRGGGGVSSENQKVHNSKCGLFDKRGGGGQIFRFFPNVNVDFKCLS